MRLNIFVTGLLILFSSTAFGANVAHSAKIKHIYQFADGGFTLRFDQDNATCTNASAPQHYYVTVSQNGITDEASKKIFAAALAAASTSKSVTIYFDETSNKCYVNRLNVQF